MISALRYEWRRITTIRSTWILLACAVIVALLMGWLMIATLSALTDAGSAGDQASEAPQVTGTDLTGMVFLATGGVIPLIFLGTIAAQSFGQEYRQGTIRLTLTAIPFRGRVFSAKLAVVLVTVAIGWIVATFFTYLLMSALASGKLTSGQTVMQLPYLGRGLLFVLGFTAIVFGVTVLTRILALGVIIPAVFWAVAEPLLITMLGGSVAGSGTSVDSTGNVTLTESSAPWIEWVLPFHNGNVFVEAPAGVTTGPNTMTAGLIYLAWVVVILGAAWTLFKKRDA